MKIQPERGGRSRRGRGALLALIAAAASMTACGGVPGPRPCTAAADCPADARCLRSYCVADAPPVAVISAPASFLSNVSYAFGGGGSYDSDPGDSVVAHAWSVAPVQATCTAVPETGSGDVLAVVFPCAGQFDVQLRVTDQLGVSSAPSTLRVAVAPAVDPPTVAVGPDLDLAHRCSGAPLLCTPVDPAQATTFAVSATGSTPAGGTLSYKWTALLPPGLADAPAPRLVFFPGDAGPTATVSIETDGTAIAGEWRFVVQATDSRGLVAVGTQRVRIRNEPPVVQGAAGPILEVPHVFSPSSPGAATGTMTALGSTPVVTASDPDGDPVQTAFTATHSGDGSASFLVQDLGDRANFSAVVLYSAPADGAYLIGPGVSRTVTFTATDPNGGVSAVTWDVQVTNRPPRVAVSVPALAVPHGFDVASSRYVAGAALSSFVDDDGDPTSLDPATGSAVCAGKGLSAATPRAAEIECAAPYAGTPAANAIAGFHAVTTTVRDAWAAASATTNLTVVNRAPRLTSSTVVLAPPCTRENICCRMAEPGFCDEYFWTQGPTTASRPPPLVDDDGDPMLVGYTWPAGGCASVSPSSHLCGPVACQVELSLCGAPRACGTSTSGTISFTATDGDLGAAGAFTVTGGCFFF